MSYRVAAPKYSHSDFPNPISKATCSLPINCFEYIHPPLCWTVVDGGENGHSAWGSVTGAASVVTVTGKFLTVFPVCFSSNDLTTDNSSRISCSATASSSLSPL